MKKKINKKFISELISIIEIVDFMESEYDSVFITSSNYWMNTNCPFPDHEDSNPSFGVNLISNKFNCFGCSKTGNIISLIQLKENLNFIETIQRLSLYAGLDVETSDFDLKYNVNQLNDTIFSFLENVETSKFPGGLSEHDFLITFAERTKKHLKNTNFDPHELEWIDTIYRNLDAFIDEENYKNIENIWKKFSKTSQERLLKWKMN